MWSRSKWGHDSLPTATPFMDKEWLIKDILRWISLKDKLKSVPLFSSCINTNQTENKVRLVTRSCGPTKNTNGSE